MVFITRGVGWDQVGREVNPEERTNTATSEIRVRRKLRGAQYPISQQKTVMDQGGWYDVNMKRSVF